MPPKKHSDSEWNLKITSIKPDDLSDYKDSYIFVRQSATIPASLCYIRNDGSEQQLVLDHNKLIVDLATRFGLSELGDNESVEEYNIWLSAEDVDALFEDHPEAALDDSDEETVRPEDWGEYNRTHLISGTLTLMDDTDAEDLELAREVSDRSVSVESVDNTKFLVFGSSFSEDPSEDSKPLSEPSLEGFLRRLNRGVGRSTLKFFVNRFGHSAVAEASTISGTIPLAAEQAATQISVPFAWEKLLPVSQAVPNHVILSKITEEIFTKFPLSAKNFIFRQAAGAGEDKKDALLTAMEEAFSSEDNRIVVLYGALGVGKSALAYKYIEQRSNLKTVRYCDLRTIKAIHSQDLSLMTQWCQNSTLSKKYLLFLDNVVNKQVMNAILQVVMPYPYVQVLITTLTPGGVNFASNAILIPPFTELEAQRQMLYFHEIAKTPEEANRWLDEEIPQENEVMRKTPLLLRICANAYNNPGSAGNFNEARLGLAVQYSPPQRELCPKSFIERLLAELPIVFHFTSGFFGGNVLNFHHIYPLQCFLRVEDHIEELWRAYQTVENTLMPNYDGTFGLLDTEKKISLTMSQLLLQAAYICYRKGYIDRAVTNINGAQEIYEKHLEERSLQSYFQLLSLVKGIILIEKYRFKEVKEIFTAITASDLKPVSKEKPLVQMEDLPIQAMAHSYLASVYSILFQFREIHRHLLQAEQRKQECSDQIEQAMTYLTQADYEYHQEQYANALQKYVLAYQTITEGIAKQYPQKSRYFLQCNESLALIHYAWGNCLRVASDFVSIQAESVESSEDPVLKMSALEHLQTAKKMFQVVFAEVSPKPLPLVRCEITLAKLCLAKHPDNWTVSQLDEAEQILTRLEGDTLENTRERIDVDYYRGRICFNRAQYDRAHIYFRKALEQWQKMVTSYDVSVNENSAPRPETTQAIQKYLGMEGEYQRILHNDYSKVLHSFAKNFYRLAHYQEAEVLFLEVIRIDLHSAGYDLNQCNEIVTIADLKLSDILNFLVEKGRKRLVITLRELIDVEYRRGHYHQAEKWLKLVLNAQLKLYAHSYSHSEVKKTIFSLSRVLVATNGFQEIPKEWLPLFQKPVNTITETDIYLQQIAAERLCAQGDYHAAQITLKEALACYRELERAEQVSPENPRILPLRLCMAKIELALGEHLHALREVLSIEAAYDRLFLNSHPDISGLHQIKADSELVCYDFGEAQRYYTFIKRYGWIFQESNENYSDRYRLYFHAAWANYLKAETDCYKTASGVGLSGYQQALNELSSSIKLELEFGSKLGLSNVQRITFHFLRMRICARLASLGVESIALLEDVYQRGQVKLSQVKYSQVTLMEQAKRDCEAAQTLLQPYVARDSKAILPIGCLYILGDLLPYEDHFSPELQDVFLKCLKDIVEYYQHINCATHTLIFTRLQTKYGVLCRKNGHFHVARHYLDSALNGLLTFKAQLFELDPDAITVGILKQRDDSKISLQLLLLLQQQVTSLDTQLQDSKQQESSLLRHVPDLLKAFITHSLHILNGNYLHNEVKILASVAANRKTMKELNHIQEKLSNHPRDPAYIEIKTILSVCQGLMELFIEILKAAFCLDNLLIERGQCDFISPAHMSLDLVQALAETNNRLQGAVFDPKGGDNPFFHWVQRYFTGTYAKLVSTVAQPSSSTPQKLLEEDSDPLCFGVPAAPKDFTGRKPQRDAIKKFLTADNKVHWIMGQSGSGKRSLASYCCDQYAKARNIFWINAKDQQSFDHSLLQLAKQLHIGQWNCIDERLLTQLATKFKKLSRPALFVLEGVEKINKGLDQNLRQLFRYISTPSHTEEKKYQLLVLYEAEVLNAPQIAEANCFILSEHFSPNSVSYLRVNQDNPQWRRDIRQLFGETPQLSLVTDQVFEAVRYHPVAISLLRGIYSGFPEIMVPNSKDNISFLKFLSEKQFKKEIVSGEEKLNHQLTVLLAWIFQAQGFWELWIKTLSYLDCVELSDTLLEEAYCECFPQQLTSMSFNDIVAVKRENLMLTSQSHFSRLLEYFVEFNVLTIHVPNISYSIHPLIKKALSQMDQGHYPARQCAMQLMRRLVCVDYFRFNTFEDIPEEYLRHARTLIARKELPISADYTALLVSAGEYLLFVRRDGRGIQTFLKDYKDIGTCLEHAKILMLLAYAHYVRGEYADSVKQLTRARLMFNELPLSKTQLIEQFLLEFFTAKILYFPYRAYPEALQKLAEVQEKLSSFIAQPKSSHSPEINRATIFQGLIYHDVGKIYTAQRVYKQAIKAYDEGLKCFEKSIGISHPLYIRTLLAKAFTLVLNKETQLARQCLMSHLGTVYWRQLFLDPNKPLMEKAQALQANYAHFCLIEACIAREEDRIDHAIIYLEKAIELKERGKEQEYDLERIIDAHLLIKEIDSTRLEQLTLAQDKFLQATQALSALEPSEFNIRESVPFNPHISESHSSIIILVDTVSGEEAPYMIDSPDSTHRSRSSSIHSTGVGNAAQEESDPGSSSDNASSASVASSKYSRGISSPERRDTRGIRGVKEGTFPLPKSKLSSHHSDIGSLSAGKSSEVEGALRRQESGIEVSIVASSTKSGSGERSSQPEDSGVTASYFTGESADSSEGSRVASRDGAALQARASFEIESETPPSTPGFDPPSRSYSILVKDMLNLVSLGSKQQEEAILEGLKLNATSEQRQKAIAILKEEIEFDRKTLKYTSGISSYYQRFKQFLHPLLADVDEPNFRDVFEIVQRIAESDLYVERNTQAVLDMLQPYQHTLHEDKIQIRKLNILLYAFYMRCDYPAVLTLLKELTPYFTGEKHTQYHQEAWYQEERWIWQFIKARFLCHPCQCYQAAQQQFEILYKEVANLKTPELYLGLLCYEYGKVKAALVSYQEETGEVASIDPYDSALCILEAALIGLSKFNLKDHKAYPVYVRTLLTKLEVLLMANLLSEADNLLNFNADSLFAKPASAQPPASGNSALMINQVYAYFIKGYIAYKKGEYLVATQALQDAKYCQDNYPEPECTLDGLNKLYELLGNSYIQQNQYSKAHNAFAEGKSKIATRLSFIEQNAAEIRSYFNLDPAQPLGAQDQQLLLEIEREKVNVQLLLTVMQTPHALRELNLTDSQLVAGLKETPSSDFSEVDWSQNSFTFQQTSDREQCIRWLSQNVHLKKLNLIGNPLSLAAMIDFLHAFKSHAEQPKIELSVDHVLQEKISECQPLRGDATQAELDIEIPKRIALVDYLYQQGRYQQAKQWGYEVLHLIVDSNLQDPKVLASIQASLAAVLHQFGSYAFVVQLYESAWQVFAKEYGENSREALRVECALARALCDMASLGDHTQYNAAIQHYEHVIATQRESFEVIRAMMGKIRVLHALDRDTEAQALTFQVQAKYASSPGVGSAPWLPNIVLEGFGRAALMATPTPHECAIFSNMTYRLENQLPEGHEEVLHGRVWRLAKERLFTFGDIWVSQDKRQVVIACRGFLGLENESLGSMRDAFIDTIGSVYDSDIMTMYRKRGFLFSTTGHSLGGLLAQCLVACHHHQDPDLSAMVFDSPGVGEIVKFMPWSRRILPEALNIQNFCSAPTPINTFGTQLGMVWYLYSRANIRFVIQTDHPDARLPECDATSGWPVHFQRVAEWPAADYTDTQYSAIVELIARSTTPTQQAFSQLCKIHRTLTSRASITPSSRALRVQAWLDPVLQTSLSSGQIEAGITAAIQAHLKIRESTNMINRPLSELSIPMQTFMKALQYVKDIAREKNILDILKLALEKKFGSESALVLMSMQFTSNQEALQYQDSIASAVFSQTDELVSADNINLETILKECFKGLKNEQMVLQGQLNNSDPLVQSLITQRLSQLAQQLNNCSLLKTELEYALESVPEVNANANVGASPLLQYHLQGGDSSRGADPAPK